MKPITRKEKIIAGEELTPITREEMFLSKYGGGGGSTVQSDLAQNDPTQPDYVKNRTHWEETTTVNEPLNITWDGNTEGLVIVADALFKVSDLVLTDEQIKTATVTLSNGNAIYIGDIWENMVSNEMVAEDCVVLPEAVAFFVRKDNIEINGFTFAQKGIYFMSYNGVYITSFTTTEPVEQTKTVVHKLDKKFLPNVETNAIVFTGVPNDEGGYDYTCNVDYAKARKALIDGATARMILVSGNEITHLTLQFETYRNRSVTLSFLDITNIDNLDGVIRYSEDGSIGSGVE